MFVHSIKNQLLANRILEKRISQELDKPEPDLSRVRACVKQLQESNEMLISRSEELYRTVKKQVRDAGADDAGADSGRRRWSDSSANTRMRCWNVG